MGQVLSVPVTMLQLSSTGKWIHVEHFRTYPTRSIPPLCFPTARGDPATNWKMILYCLETYLLCLLFYLKKIGISMGPSTGPSTTWREHAVRNGRLFALPPGSQRILLDLSQNKGYLNISPLYLGRWSATDKALKFGECKILRQPHGIVCWTASPRIMCQQKKWPGLYHGIYTAVRSAL